HEIPPDSAIPWDITQERPGYFIEATIAFRDVDPSDYGGMFISGGRAPEYLRYDEDLLRIVRAMVSDGRPIACVCHGIEILSAAGVIGGKTVTTVAKCALDARQGGAEYVDREVVVDAPFVTARTWHDNAPLMREFLAMLQEQEGKA
ncbi:MAG TPA: peptidase, partial [Planctomycetaceae bacterium]|nr:peptidase [Planctomycetaceae bacterium]